MTAIIAIANNKDESEENLKLYNFLCSSSDSIDKVDIPKYSVANDRVASPAH
jgi:hypothetical protein